MLTKVKNYLNSDIRIEKNLYFFKKIEYLRFPFTFLRFRQKGSQGV